MEPSIKMLQEYALTDNVLDLEKKSYFYHGKFIPYLDDISAIISIIKNGILSIDEQRKMGILKNDNNQLINDDMKTSIKNLKLKIFNSLINQRKMKLYYNNLHTANGPYYISVSSDKNHFSRIFDIVFILKDNVDYIKTVDNPECARKYINTKVSIRGGVPNEYQRIDRISHDEFVGIQLQLDKMLDENTMEYMGIPKDESALRIIRIVNDIYDALEENNLDIPIINGSDNRIVNKEFFRMFKNSLENFKTSKDVSNQIMRH